LERIQRIQFVSLLAALPALVTMSEPGLAQTAQPRTWDTAALKDIVWAISGGESFKFAPWKREDRDGDERWVTRNATEFWEVRPYIVVHGARIGTPEAANRFVIMMTLVTTGVFDHEDREAAPNLGTLLARLAQQVADGPKGKAAQEIPHYLLTVVRSERDNVWVYSIEPR